MMRNKSRELGVFTVGIGIIFSAIVLYGLFITPLRGQEGVILKFVPFLIPGAILVLAGVCLLAIPSKTTVKVATGIVTFAFVADALLVFNPIKWIISAACVYLVWKTARQSLEQIARGY